MTIDLASRLPFGSRDLSTRGARGVVMRVTHIRDWNHKAQNTFQLRVLYFSLPRLDFAAIKARKDSRTF